MALLHLESLPPRTTKGTLVRLLTQVGQLDRGRIGGIELHGRTATIEVPERWVARLVKALDGTKLGHRFIRARHGTLSLPSRDEDFFQRLLRLIDLESEAQTLQLQRDLQQGSSAAAESNGSSLVDLVLRDEVTGLGGRRILTLSKRDTRQTLPWTRLGPGSPVLLSGIEDEPQGVRGVVCRREERSIEVAITQSPAAINVARALRLDHCSDEVSRQRQSGALRRAQTARGDRLSVLRKLLLGDQPLRFHARTELSPFDRSLNPTQIEAVEHAMAAEDLAIIHGPPGTGKSTTVVEVIRQAVGRQEKVLACAPSNLAVDNLFERLLATGERVVRLGHPARVLPELRKHTLDMLVEQHPDIKLVRKLMKEAYALLDKANKFTRTKPPPGAKREQRNEAKQLLDDARRLESQVVQQVIDSADVLCTTLTGIDSDLLGQRVFDLVVIDEACQTTEPACWIPLARSHRIVLAGDHCQLPPTVVSAEAERDGFGVSMMERLMSRCGRQAARQLSVQYRMHRHIMEFSSAEFYDDSLVASESVAEHRLDELPGIAEADATRSPLMFVDTAGGGFDDEQEEPGRSYLNAAEADVVARKVAELLAAGVTPSQIAVITPYSAQVRCLRSKLDVLGLEIDTVDGFQGREKEAVVISLVRSNSAGQIGFLADTRRMNVALTRARRRLILIGDSATIAGHPFYERMLNYMEQRGAYRTIWEESIE